MIDLHSDQMANLADLARATTGDPIRELREINHNLALILAELRALAKDTATIADTMAPQRSATYEPMPGWPRDSDSVPPKDYRAGTARDPLTVGSVRGRADAYGFPHPWRDE